MNPIELFNGPKSIAPRRRMFAGARIDRTTSDFVGSSSSIDSEIYTSLRPLRNRSRELVRDNDYAKQAVRIFKNQVVGPGIGLQAEIMQRRGGKIDEALCDAVEDAWEEWCRKEFCSTNGKYSFAEIQRMAIDAQPVSGEILIRKVRRSFGGSRVPLALEVIESDQLVDNYSVGKAEGGNAIKMGVEIDQWGRAVAYHLYPRHPGDFQFAATTPSNRYIRVPAEDMIHLYLKDERPGMTRGIPLFHTAIRRLNNMGGYEEAEIVAARAAACIMGFIESPDEDAVGTDAVENGERVTALGAGEVKELAPGEKFTGFAPNRPNAAMEPFMRFMLRGLSAGLGISYESISRDYSQSNFSSSRLSQIDDRDHWRALQAWLIADLCENVANEWLDLAVMAGVLDLPGYEANPQHYRARRWKPRGWGYVNPLQEAMADKLRVRSGFTSVADVISENGGDYEDVFKQRKREIDLAASYNLVLETDPAMVNDKGQLQPDPEAAAASTAADAGTGATGSDAGAEGDQSKVLLLLYTSLERAIETGRDELALKLLARIDEIEGHAGKPKAA